MGYRKAVETRVASAVFALLEAEASSFSIPITFTKGPLPVFKKEALAAARGFVVPLSKTLTRLDRERESVDVVVGVSVVKSVGLTSSSSEDAEVEDLVSLCEEIVDFLSTRTDEKLDLVAIENGSGDEIQAAGDAILTGPISQDPLFDPASLREEKIFRAVVSFTYQTQTARA